MSVTKLVVASKILDVPVSSIKAMNPHNCNNDCDTAAMRPHGETYTETKLGTEYNVAGRSCLSFRGQWEVVLICFSTVNLLYDDNAKLTCFQNKIFCVFMF